MPTVSKLPYEFVNYLRDPGLNTVAGAVPLDQYMSKTIKNGGNDNTTSLLKNLRWMREGGAGARLDDIVGTRRMDILLKGQGHPDDFVTVMNFIVNNKEAMKKLKVKVGHRPEADRQNLVVDREGSVYALYFDGKSDADGLHQMVQDRFFGIDCIGFVANYMSHVELWDKYYGHDIDNWDRVFKKPVPTVADVKPLNIMLWNGHIAIVDWVWSVDEANGTCTIDMCQSSRGGPQCNERVVLKQTKRTKGEGRTLFKMMAGTPKPPIDDDVFLMGMEGLELGW